MSAGPSPRDLKSDDGWETNVAAPLDVLVCEPYFGGSHRQFLEQWIQRSRHRFHALTLPARWWKWRMRHSALDFAQRIDELLRSRSLAQPFDLVFCSDMVNVAELRGLTHGATGALPHVLYFHENQLTYPVSNSVAAAEQERDRHFAMVNLVSAAASDELWFNSAFHRGDFLAAIPEFLGRMPDAGFRGLLEVLPGRSHVEPLGVEDRWDDESSRARLPGPLRIGWVARWEHDKDPDTFFGALEELARREVGFRVSVMGERFSKAPACFAEFRERHAARIERWGHLPRRADYCRELAGLDVVVSTARHEFFGVAVVEALLAGALPLLPDRLSYPELLAEMARPSRRRYPDQAGSGEESAYGFYSGGVLPLADRLARLASEKEKGNLHRGAARSSVLRFSWAVRAAELDQSLSAAWARHQGL